MTHKEFIRKAYKDLGPFRFLDFVLGLRRFNRMRGLKQRLIVLHQARMLLGTTELASRFVSMLPKNIGRHHFPLVDAIRMVNTEKLFREQQQCLDEAEEVTKAHLKREADEQFKRAQRASEIERVEVIRQSSVRPRPGFLAPRPRQQKKKKKTKTKKCVTKYQVSAWRCFDKWLAVACGSLALLGLDLEFASHGMR